MRNLLVLSGVLLATATAHADAKYTRKPNLVIDTKQTDRTKPLHAVTTIQGRPVTATEVMKLDEGAQPIRRDQEAILEQLVKDTPVDDPDKPDLMFRLAEHYAKQMRFWRLKSIEATMPPKR